MGAEKVTASLRCVKQRRGTVSLPEQVTEVVQEKRAGVCLHANTESCGAVVSKRRVLTARLTGCTVMDVYTAGRTKASQSP